MRVGPTLFCFAMILVAVVPAASADHPGSNLGLARFAPLAGENVVHRLPDVEAAFMTWESAWPGYVERFQMGTTSSGFPLLGIVITDESVADADAGVSTGQKMRVYLDGGHHGNEYLGVELVMYYLEDVLNLAAAGDEGMLDFLRQTEIYAVPIINVDGNALDTRKNSRQVDPNRNYDFHWGEAGASDFIGDFTYRGPSPHSEAEVQANAEFGAELRPDLWITMHTGVAEFYWPWGWTDAPTPDDAFFTSLEGPFENATNGRVDAMQAAELYLAAGATDDYGYGVVGVPTFTYEVHEDQFVPVYGEPIPEVIADQLAGLDFMVRNVQRMGAWVEPSGVPGGIELQNQGWAVARNVTLSVGGNNMLIDEIGPLETVFVPMGEVSGTARVEYKPLLIETSLPRVHTVQLDALPPIAEPESVPGAGPLLVLLVLALAGLALRRR